MHLVKMCDVTKDSHTLPQTCRKTGLQTLQCNSCMHMYSVYTYVCANMYAYVYGESYGQLTTENRWLLPCYCKHCMHKICKQLKKSTDRNVL